MAQKKMKIEFHFQGSTPSYHPAAECQRTAMGAMTPEMFVVSRSFP